MRAAIESISSGKGRDRLRKDLARHLMSETPPVVFSGRAFVLSAGVKGTYPLNVSPGGRLGEGERSTAHAVARGRCGLMPRGKQYVRVTGCVERSFCFPFPNKIRLVLCWQHALKLSVVLDHFGGITAGRFVEYAVHRIHAPSWVVSKIFCCGHNVVAATVP